ncbi:MAG: restriction endonuclease subunit S [Armatimonadetes bacterium]|nr:restriction endonuclease subunit S [Chthoniobacterales bacterium]MBA3726361.1 restriction endonuclease subunit S [Armatimonadota bacterium]
MATEQRELTFQQLIDERLLEIGDGYRAQNSELGGTGPIFLRAGHVTDSHIDFTGVEHFHEHLADKVRPKMSKVGDTIITTKGNSTGRTSFVTDRLPPFVYSPHLSYWRSRDEEELCGGFLRYWSQGREFGEQLSGMKTSTDMAPYLSLTDQRRLKITLPSPAEQKAIAAVLGALDDKIELNRRMNATLEAMARALFQSWFVDFDPVRSKLDGRYPAGLDPATAALFPATFQDSALGPIPHGWEASSLADKIELLSGGTPKTSQPAYWDGDIPWYSVKDAPSETDVWVIHTEKRVTKEGIANSAAQILPEGTTIISARGTVGKLALVGTPMAMNQSCGTEGYGDFFTYFALRQATADLQQRTHGTVFDTITRQTFETLDCIFPPANLTVAFDRTAAPLLAQIRANLHQSRILATLRDTLLPKLLSGELKVGKISERTVAA